MTAQPCQCSAAVLINRECIWGQCQHQQGQVPGNMPSPHDSLGKHCCDRSTEVGSGEAPRPNPEVVWTGSGGTAGKGSPVSLLL